jgi:hypothetical protein
MIRRFEEEVEHIACEGDRTYQRVDPDIGGHARQLPLRHAQVPRFPHDPRAHRGGRQVTHDGDQPNQTVQSHATVGAGDDEQPLQHGLHGLDPPPDRCGIATKAGQVAHHAIKLVLRKRHSCSSNGA